MQRGSVPSVQSKALHTFSRSPQAGLPRSSFDRSHGVKTTFNEGYIVPILVDEMLPGDTFNLKMHAFVRTSTLLFPIMDNMYLESFFFAVPFRILWSNWQKFNGEQTDPGDSTDFVIPQLVMPASVGAAEGSLADYFGIPIGIADLSVSAIPFRAYNLIYNEWFRHEDLQDSTVVSLTDGPDTYSNYDLLRRGKRYDYFTSCLPFPQKGPDVELPLGTTAPVESFTTAGAYQPTLSYVNSTAAPNASQTAFKTDASGYLQSTAANVGVFYDPSPNLRVDLSDATAATINDLRLAFQTQKLYEKDARGGTRYTEIIKAHFDVVSPDMRLQRPEFIGGGSSTVMVNPVAQTAPGSDSTNSLGQLAAYGTCAVSEHGFTYSATEHMCIIGLVSVRADLNYQQGLNRLWSRSTRLDFYWPVLSHIGEQAVLNKEIYAQGTSADDEVFGYQERFAEYRYKPSLITGLFRSDATGTLDSWHLAQDFASLPALNDEFIVEDAPMSRVLALESQPDFLFDAFLSYRCARPMPTYAVPGLVDHF